MKKNHQCRCRPSDNGIFFSNQRVNIRSIFAVCLHVTPLLRPIHYSLLTGGRFLTIACVWCEALQCILILKKRICRKTSRRDHNEKEHRQYSCRCMLAHCSDSLPPPSLVWQEFVKRYLISNLNKGGNEK